MNNIANIYANILGKHIATIQPAEKFIGSVEVEPIVEHHSVLQGCIMASLILCLFFASIIIIFLFLKGAYDKGWWPVFERHNWRKKQVIIHITWTILCITSVWGLVHIYINQIALLDIVQDCCNNIDAICGINSNGKNNYPILVNIVSTFIALFLTFRALRPHILIYPEVLYEVRREEDRREETDKTYSHLLFQVWNKGLFAIHNIQAVLYACKYVKDTGNIHRCEIPIVNHNYVSLDWCLAHPDNSRMLISTEKNKFDETRGFDYLELQITITHPVSNVTKTFTRKIYHENIHRGKFIRKKWWHILSRIYYYSSLNQEEERKRSGVVILTHANACLTMIEYIGCIALVITIPLAYYMIFRNPQYGITFSVIIELLLVFILVLEILRKITILPLLQKWQESCLYLKQSNDTTNENN